MRAIRTTAGRLSVVAAAAAALGIAGWWFVAKPVATATGIAAGSLARGVAAERLNVVLITLDTTRWDRLGGYGARDGATPSLDRLAREGVLFEHAIAPAPLTLPAHATIFTGALPPDHGVRDNGGYVLHERHHTLAERLRARGRRTGAFVGAFVLDSRWGLDQGFDTYVDDFEPSTTRMRSLGEVSRPAGEVVDSALPWLETHAGEPFFAWLHFYDPHSPYEPPEPFRSRFPGRPYVGEIAYVDSQIARVLEWLDARGVADRTVVAALGDHGESLGEHGEDTHGLFVYDATIRVPLIIRAPHSGLRGRRVASLVRSQDVAATLLDLAGIAPPAETPGVSLVPLMAGAVEDLDLEAYSESYYARHHYGWSELRALRAGRYKFIDAPRPELYDLQDDGAETRNLYEERRALANQMALALERVARAQGPLDDHGPASVDSETRARLAALGYIGTAPALAPLRPGERLPDPKDKIDIVNLMLRVREHAGRENEETPIARLERVLALDPRILDAWIMLGNEHLRRGDPATALVHYQKALALNPDSDLATVNLATAYRALGRSDAAILGYERYLTRDPKNAYVRAQLGELLLEANELARAEEALAQALVDDPRVASARHALGVLALKRGDLDAAERDIRAALAEQPALEAAHFNLALVAEQRQDLDSAVQEYRRELDRHADSYRAAFNLARLYERLGDGGQYETWLRRSIVINPAFAEAKFYLAKLHLDRGDLEGARTLAREGLAAAKLANGSPVAPLGHYVLADVYTRLGRAADAAREAEHGRRLEQRR